MSTSLECQPREFALSLTGPAGQEAIAVRQMSAGEHSFVAWHGITAVNRFWLWDILWPYGTVSLAGLPGHGPLPPRSPDAGWRWTPDHFIDVGIATLQSLTRGQPATLIGHSTGGMIALGIAHKAPELVERLILIAPVIWSELIGIVGLWQRFARYPQLLQLVIGASLGPGRQSRQVFYASLVAFIADYLGFYGNARAAAAIRHGYAHMRQTPIAAIAATTRVLSQADLRPLIQRRPARAPTLLIHGARDPIVPVAQSQWLAATLPQVEFLRLPRAGHLPFGEQEALTNQAIQAWLQRHPLPHGGRGGEGVI